MEQVMKQKKILIVVGVIGVAIVGWFVFGNTGANALMGRWEYVATFDSPRGPQFGRSAPSEFDFFPDGSAALNLGGMRAGVTWTVEGDRLTLHHPDPMRPPMELRFQISGQNLTIFPFDHFYGFTNYRSVFRRIN